MYRAALPDSCPKGSPILVGGVCNPEVQPIVHDGGSHERPKQLVPGRA